MGPTIRRLTCSLYGDHSGLETVFLPRVAGLPRSDAHLLKMRQRCPVPAFSRHNGARSHNKIATAGGVFLSIGLPPQSVLPLSLAHLPYGSLHFFLAATRTDDRGWEVSAVTGNSLYLFTNCPVTLDRLIVGLFRSDMQQRKFQGAFCRPSGHRGAGSGIEEKPA